MNITPSILTASGNLFHFVERSNNILEIEDIAHALSHICRFTGHTKEFYSVAQHSVLVSYIVDPDYALQGLLHDAAESVLGDVSSPLKQLLPDYKALERSIEKTIFEKFGLPETLHPSVKAADLRMLVTEQRDLMPKLDEAWASFSHIKPLDISIFPVGPIEAKQRFLDRYKQLMSLNADNSRFSS